MSRRRKLDITKLMDDEDPEFQIAPMIDVLLVLLTFFMSITTTDVLQKDKDITLPKASDAAAARKGDDTGTAVVNVSWIGNRATIKLDDSPLSGPAALANELTARRKDFQRARPKARYRVIVRGDVSAHFSAVRDVMEACAAAEINNVTFSVVQEGQYTAGGAAGAPAVPATPATP
jgi:biopolymer transport protein ExbD